MAFSNQNSSKSTMDTIADEAKKKSDQVSGALSGLKEDIKDKASDFSEKLSDKASELSDKASEFGSKVSDKASEMGDKPGAGVDSWIGRGGRGFEEDEDEVELGMRGNRPSVRTTGGVPADAFGTNYPGVAQRR